MGKYLKKFENHTQYENARQNLILPNVSLCAQENEVHYNPIEPPLPNNVIKYEASAKLSETTNPESGGIHTNAFNTTMVSHTFENGVGTIEFEDDVTILGDWAFGFSKITKISIPNSVTSINYHAFIYCASLTSITIPNSVTSIGSYAFNYCTSLTSITIPNSVTSIGSYAFADCSGLTSISVDSNNAVYDSRGDCNAIIETATNTLISGCKNTIIPNSVTSIGDGAFAGYSGLTSITIPNSVASIGDYAFASCYSLTSITIPNSVTSIGGDAFYYCSGLTSITIPNSVTSIGGDAFFYCSGLTSVTIGSGVTTIGNSAFKNCGNVQYCTINSITPPAIEQRYSQYPADETFSGNYPIYVPSESVNAYKTAQYWSHIASRIQAIPTT